MTVEEYISQQPENRQTILRSLHEVIIANDPSVSFILEPMMGKDMIIYKQSDTMKYALANGKAHMSLHCLPIYLDAELYAKYFALLPSAKVQKGCINFTKAEQLPVAIAGDLIADCAGINIAEVLANRKKK
ncbi:DUF1801 domain-containing protein [Mucilaginibacter glaciei]|uniref:DUF1801 domain-containing protein n=1 Tax=Mucilaginibacter glaciei TaxID=2772109 RepID=A0A926P0H2_9SPHI|nr:DUF1801 domain-containing protein [Mucilaginibacter glaciei]MBD1395383.1 DUF1801 domain-containing protein [Mucilaginibacter glaciei]